MLRDGPEHFKVWVPDEPEARNYFENIPPGDPGVYHTTREMIFVRLDIAKFTQFPENIQPRVLAELHELVHGVLQKRMFAMEPSKAPERVLHTGDGFILAFAMPTGDVRPWPLQLAQNMAKALDQRNDKSIPIRFRIAVTTGPVYVTGDLSGIPNYIGSSISESERLLQCIPSNQDDVVCFSEAIYRKYRGGLSAMKFFRMGSVSDKHQTMHRLYLLEYTD
jgi:class 3 adenylate cyclase